MSPMLATVVIPCLRVSQGRHHWQFQVSSPQTPVLFDVPPVPLVELRGESTSGLSDKPPWFGPKKVMSPKGTDQTTDPNGVKWDPSYSDPENVTWEFATDPLPKRTGVEQRYGGFPTIFGDKPQKKTTPKSRLNSSETSGSKTLDTTYSK